MKVLYITGSCLTRNTSANMSHNAFVQGLLENGCDVEILMSSDSWGAEDKGLPRWEQAHYHSFSSASFPDRILQKLRGSMPAAEAVAAPREMSSDLTAQRHGLGEWVKAVFKKLFHVCFPRDPLYPLDKAWLKRASAFQSDTKYDLVISNSSPAASHRLVLELKEKKRIRFDRWIQVWEDPWYHDLYGGHSELVERGEHKLLQAASEVVYVSPLTLMYQKRYYPDCAEKMRCIPLPALRLGSEGASKSPGTDPVFGYFGDYYSHTRDLKPFYEALVASGYRGSIVGDSDLHLPGTDRICASPRVTLDKLQAIQENTDILVHLSNLKGGQIPGKIYHYSVTDKPILFILDGTEEEQNELRRFFEPLDRYCFCANESISIQSALSSIVRENRNNQPVASFLPEQVVKKLL